MIKSLTRLPCAPCGTPSVELYGGSNACPSLAVKLFIDEVTFFVLNLKN